MRNWKNAIVFGGGILAFVVGAGFASGQEIMQFFATLGFWKSIGSGLVAMVLVSWFSLTIMEDGRKLQLEDENTIFAHYCGKIIGKFFEYFVPVLMFLVASMMISAAGATVSEHFGVNPNVGRIFMAIVTLITVLLGLKKLVHIVGYIAPVIIIFTMFVGISGFLKNTGGITESVQVIEDLEISGTYSNWIISGIMYAAFLVVGLVPYIAGIGKQANNKKETTLGGLFAGILFLAGVIILGTGMIANIGAVYDKEIPALALASQNSTLISSIFAIFLILAIYTTAVPMLWTAINKVVRDENSNKYKIVAVVLTIFAFIGGHLPFSTMVGIVYPATGYMGLLIFVGMLYTRFIKKPNLEVNDTETETEKYAK